MLFLFNKFFHYPLQLYELIFRFNPLKTLHITTDFLIANIIYKYIAVPDDNFESWCIKRFGKTLYNILFGNYTKKVWGIEPKYISHKFAEQKIKKLKFKDIIHKILGGKGEEHEIYWENLLYFKYGSGELINGFVKSISNNNIIINNINIEQIKYEKNKITEIIYKDNKTQNIKSIKNFDLIISTIPISSLMYYLSDKSNKIFHILSKSIKYRNLLLVYLFFDTEQLINNHWIYLSDPKFIYNRVSEQKNMSSHIAPHNKTFLIFEKTMDEKNNLWYKNEKELVELALKDFKKIKKDIPNCTDYKIMKIPNAYPLYNLRYDENLNIIFNYLSEFNNLFLTGRQGLFLQNDMFDNILLSKSLSKFIQNKKKPHEWYEQHKII